ncbi:MAG: glycoside hydrolase family 28 protein [Ignavibacteria bacterium]|jgi:polygalacturonase
MKKILSLVVISLLIISCGKSTQSGNVKGWDGVENILSRIKPPEFPANDFNIVEMGAVADGKTDCLPVIKKAIESCSKIGGGKIIIPAGTFFCKGPIHLKSNINLNLSEGAVLKFSTDPKDYLPVVYTRWEGVECMNYSPMVYAYKQENLGITGKGILDGQAGNENWWAWNGNKKYGWKEGMPNQNDGYNRPALFKYNEKGTPIEKRVFGEGHHLRPNFIQFYDCKKIVMEDFTVKDSPMWIIHPVLSSNITIRNIKSIGHGPNNDGCDPESCKDVLIESCYFNNGDDCIAIKSGRNQDGRRINAPSENIIVRNCEMKDGHGGVVMGSEISGGCRNIFVEDCLMDSPNLDRAVRIKSNSYRGGFAENIYVRNIEVGEVADAVVRLNMLYDPKEGTDGKHHPAFRNIFLKNIKSTYGLRLEGSPESKIQNVVIENCSFENVSDGNIIENVDELNLEDLYINEVKTEY